MIMPLIHCRKLKKLNTLKLFCFMNTHTIVSPLQTFISIFVFILVFNPPKSKNCKISGKGELAKFAETSKKKKKNYLSMKMSLYKGSPLNFACNIKRI